MARVGRPLLYLMKMVRAAAKTYSLLTIWSKWTHRPKGRNKRKALGPKERNIAKLTLHQFFGIFFFLTFSPGKFAQSSLNNLSLEKQTNHPQPGMLLMNFTKSSQAVKTPQEPQLVATILCSGHVALSSPFLLPYGLEMKCLCPVLTTPPSLLAPMGRTSPLGTSSSGSKSFCSLITVAATLQCEKNHMQIPGPQPQRAWFSAMRPSLEPECLVTSPGE